jgi:hypothetical protein
VAQPATDEQGGAPPPEPPPPLLPAAALVAAMHEAVQFGHAECLERTIR